MALLNDKRTIDLIGVQIDFGASQKGVAMGPLAIRYAGLKNDLKGMGYWVHDKGDIVPPEDGMSLRHMIRFEQVNATNKQLYDEVYDTLEDGRFPLVLGGDHSVAAGSVSAVAKYYEPQGEIGIIWIDAHGDWNDDNSTETGNMHGMPYSAVCGWGPDSMVDFGQKPHFVPTAHCVQVAGHDFDPAEAERMKEAGMNVFSMTDVDRRGMTEIMEEAIRIASTDTVGIHLSFDVDAITPEYAPGTGTPVPNGITAREAFLAVEMIARSGKLISMDLVEVNPILDERNKTGILASELIQLAMGKQIF
ncbi:MAG: arginase [Clostridiales bacterium]|jgi:arginase|nr:arginase [Clostridiales bacterium]